METRSTESGAGDLRRAVKTGGLNKVAGETHRGNGLEAECAADGGSTRFASYCPELGSVQWACNAF